MGMLFLYPGYGGRGIKGRKNMNYVLYEISLCQKCSKIALKCGLTHNVVKCCFLYERNKGGSIMKRISIVSFPPQKYLNFLFEIITLLSYNFGY